MVLPDDRARDLAALVSDRVNETGKGWPLASSTRDQDIVRAVSALQSAGSTFAGRAETAKLEEPASRAFVRRLEAPVPEVVAAVARATDEVFSVADDRVMRGALFRVVESSDSMRELTRNRQTDDGADALEPEGTNQTFRLANLHALARDIEGKLT